MRKTILAFLSVLIASIIACQHGLSTLDVSQLNVCNSKEPPIVCIDPNSLVPSQNPVVIHGKQWAHFYMTTGKGNLTITCDPRAPVAYVSHSGPHAWLQALPVDKTSGPWKYTIEVDGRKNDPEMVIEP
jgi:hypothetical protein